MNFERASPKYPDIFKEKRYMEKKKYQRYIGKGIGKIPIIDIKVIHNY